MTESEARNLVVSALTSANVPGFSGSPEEAAFLAGDQNTRIMDLQMDSLAAMEFCIALELDAGLSVSPDELRLFGTLEKLVNVICAQ